MPETQMKGIRFGLAKNIRDFLVDGFQVSEYMLSDPTLPCIWIMGPSEINFDTAMRRGGDEIMVLVQAMIAMVDDIGAQQILDELCDGSGRMSLKEAIQTDTTLGGICDDLRVVRSSGFLVYERAEGNILGAEWTVQVEGSNLPEDD